MKNLILLAIFTVLLGCKQSNRHDGVFVVDVEASYPNKELTLQDIVDVEYIPLETNDEFICQGFVRAVGNEIMVVTNFKSDGDIFLFDKKGKGIRKINRLGRGGEEYIGIIAIALDENAGELFVNDYQRRKVLVYDLNGKYNRSFSHNDSMRYVSMLNFGSDYLICADVDWKNHHSFSIISKKEGSTIKQIEIPFIERKSKWVFKRDEEKNLTYGKSAPSNPIIPFMNEWILVGHSSDTVYRLTKDLLMSPFLVRTPLIQSMNPEVFLFPRFITNRYCFMSSVKKEYNFDSDDGFPSTEIVYDMNEKTLSRYTVFNDDYTSKQTVYMFPEPGNQEMAGFRTIQAHQLVQSYKN